MNLLNRIARSASGRLSGRELCGFRPRWQVHFRHEVFVRRGAEHSRVEVVMGIIVPRQRVVVLQKAVLLVGQFLLMRLLKQREDREGAFEDSREWAGGRHYDIERPHAMADELARFSSGQKPMLLSRTQCVQANGLENIHPSIMGCEVDIQRSASPLKISTAESKD
jgi:hypothetical protein